MYQQRPTWVTIIIVLFFIAGGVAILSGLYLLATNSLSVSASLTSMLGLEPLRAALLALQWAVQLESYKAVIGIVAVIVGGLDIAVGWGLMTAKDWARIVAVILLTLNVVGNLAIGLALLVGVDMGGEVKQPLPGPGIVSILYAGIAGVMVWYLLKPDVADYFLGGAGVGMVGAMQITLPPTPVPMTPPPAIPPTRGVGPYQSVSSYPQAQPPRVKTDVLGAPSAPIAFLVVQGGPRHGKQFGLSTGDNRIGRDGSQCQVVLEDTSVSGEHTMIRFENNQFYVQDLASRNGTLVNNQRVSGKRLLYDGDMIRVGETTMVFKKVETHR
jgi:hypothetical protein